MSSSREMIRDLEARVTALESRYDIQQKISEIHAAITGRLDAGLAAQQYAEPRPATMYYQPPAANRQREAIGVQFRAL